MLGLVLREEFQVNNMSGSMPWRPEPACSHFTMD